MPTPTPATIQRPAASTPNSTLARLTAVHTALIATGVHEGSIDTATGLSRFELVHAGRIARDELVAELLPAIRRMVQHEVRCAAHEREDVVQDAIVILLEIIDAWSPERSTVLLPAIRRRVLSDEYLVTLGGRAAAGVTVQALRNERRARRAGAEDPRGFRPTSTTVFVDGEPVNVLEELPDQGPTPEDAALTRERNTSIRSAIDSVLSDNEAAIVSLRFGLDGLPPMTHAEIAELRGMTEGAVKVSCSRALARLRNGAPQLAELM